MQIFLVVRTAISSKLASDTWIRRTIVIVRNSHLYHPIAHIIKVSHTALYVIHFDSPCFTMGKSNPLFVDVVESDYGIQLGLRRPDLIYRVKFYCVVQDAVLCVRREILTCPRRLTLYHN